MAAVALSTPVSSANAWLGSRATPMHDAVRAGDYARLSSLVETSGDLEQADMAGRTPLALAVALGAMAAASRGDRTPICKTCTGMAVLLISAGADVHAVDSNGESLLDLAFGSKRLTELATICGCR